MNPDEVRKNDIGDGDAYIPQSADETRSTPPRRSSALLKMSFKNMVFMPPRRILMKVPKRCLRPWGCQRVFCNKYPVELSGGMKQRTVIAVSVSLLPKVLIC